MAQSRDNIPQISPQRSERIETVKTLVCRGLDRATILQFASEKGWHEEPGDIDHYIEAANLELAKDAGDIDTEIEMGKAHARLNHLYQVTVKVQDFKTALSIQKEINKILTLKVAARTRAVPAPQQERTPLKIIQGKRNVKK